jgi:hypothetical protein
MFRIVSEPGLKRGAHNLMTVMSQWTTGIVVMNVIGRESVETKYAVHGVCVKFLALVFWNANMAA